MALLRNLSNKDIDRKLWDACVAGAYIGLPYAYSWYLDAVAQNWDGLVYGNYEAVMPMVWVRKYGIPCMYQPYYCQQLGVYSSIVTEADLMAQFMDIAGASFPYIEVNLNKAHEVNAQAYGLTERKNLLLQLNKPYTELSKGFSANHKRNVAKAAKADLVFSTNVSMAALKEFYLASINREREKFTSKTEAVFTRLMDELIQHQMAEVYTASHEEKVLAAVVMIPHKDRLINIINSSNKEGKAQGASHFLFSKIIEHHAESGYTLDFEGSSVTSIARFYEGFGAQAEMFYRWKTNVLKKASQLFK